MWLLCWGHFVNHIQVADNQIPINFHRGPGPRVGAVLGGEVRVKVLSSPAGRSRSAPLHTSTAHRRQAFQKLHPLEQSWDWTHESSVPSLDILVGTASYTLACALWWEGAGLSPLSTHPHTHKSLWYEQKPFVNLKETTS